MSKDTFYFSHDYNARNDEKIKRLIKKHGMAGYGLFWSIIEDLYNNANALRTDYESIAYDLRTDEIMIRSVINDFDLFVFKDDYFGSLSIEKRINERNEKSKKARKSALARWGEHSDDAFALVKDANASKNDAINKGNKEKEINKEGFCVIFKNETIKTKPYDFLMQRKSTEVEGLMMNMFRGIDIAKFEHDFNHEYNGYSFEDDNHLHNTAKSKMRFMMNNKNTSVTGQPTGKKFRTV